MYNELMLPLRVFYFLHQHFACSMFKYISCSFSKMLFLQIDMKLADSPRTGLNLFLSYTRFHHHFC